MDSLSFGEMIRAVASTPPPGAKVTISRTGRVGYGGSAACTTPAAMQEPSRATAFVIQPGWTRFVMSVSSLDSNARNRVNVVHTVGHPVVCPGLAGVFCADHLPAARHAVDPPRVRGMHGDCHDG